jgi:hypothetical protein
VASKGTLAKLFPEDDKLINWLERELPLLPNFMVNR